MRQLLNDTISIPGVIRIDWIVCDQFETRLDSSIFRGPESPTACRLQFDDASRFCGLVDGGNDSHIL